MRHFSDDFSSIVTTGSFTRELTADAYLGGKRTLENIPVDDWNLAGDYDANIKNTATARIIYQDDFAKSYTPREASDALAAFGQELHLFMTVSAGDFSERIRVGIFRIDEVPSAYDRKVMHENRELTIGSVIDLDLVDRFATVNWPTRTLDAPAALGSAWSEIVRVSRLQVTRTVPDKSIPNSIVYPRNRLSTVQQLAGVLGGRAMMLSDGTLGVIPDEYSTPDLTLTTGEPAGTIVGTGYSMRSREIANAVYGDFEAEDGTPIHAEAAITVGDLSTLGPFGERPVEYPGDQKAFIRTQRAADTAVQNHLAKVSRRGPVEIPVTLVPDPRIEIGDVLEVSNGGTPQIARAVKYSLPKKGAMQLTVRTAG